MKVWLAKLAQTYPQVAIIDGFASAGRSRFGPDWVAARVPGGVPNTRCA